MAEGYPMDIYEVMKQLPHRYPLLLVDRVLECVPGKRISAIKNVTFNEPYFTGHFPHRPVMPGVMMVEALAQTTGLLAFATVGRTPLPHELYYFVSIDKAKFRRPVEPGDQLLLEAELTRNIKDVWCFSTRALVDGKVVTSADIKCARGEIEP